MNRREVQAKPHGFTPWVENVVGVLLLPMMLLVYLSPIIFVVGGIIWFGVVFGEDGTRIQRRIEQAFVAQDQPAFEVLPMVRQREVVQQLVTVVDLASKTNSATVTSCRPERVPLAVATSRQLRVAQTLVPDGMRSVRDQLALLALEVRSAVTECRVSRSRYSHGNDSGFGNSVWTLRRQVGHMQALLPSSSPEP
ncbi:hypothetical protein [Deinococcus aquaedulcis]|uniref:hypothetical protein n=1 Tax=Deinococcus aquaedulcis TaxID=2840455 RepID=UPI001C8353C2|nr:hypothetical protein [Deinococcus aquaedulcis]